MDSLANFNGVRNRKFTLVEFDIVYDRAGTRPPDTLLDWVDFGLKNL